MARTVATCQLPSAFWTNAVKLYVSRVYLTATCRDGRRISSYAGAERTVPCSWPSALLFGVCVGAFFWPRQKWWLGDITVGLVVFQEMSCAHLSTGGAPRAGEGVTRSPKGIILSNLLSC